MMWDILNQIMIKEKDDDAIITDYYANGQLKTYNEGMLQP